MITRIEAGKRYRARYDWLETYYLFSFAQYFDPDNLGFGALRVFNDDRIAPFSGFDEHGHENMEIVTVMLSGRLTHRDSMGHQQTIEAGELQCMTAGTGVIHAEKNLHDEPVHLYQIWFQPVKQQLEPRYAQATFLYEGRNALVPLASTTPEEGALTLLADASLYGLDLEEGREISYALPAKRGFFVYLERGCLTINGVEFRAGDQARITDEKHLVLLAKEATRALCIDVGGIASTESPAVLKE